MDQPGQQSIDAESIAHSSDSTGTDISHDTNMADIALKNHAPLPEAPDMMIERPPLVHEGAASSASNMLDESMSELDAASRASEAPSGSIDSESRDSNSGISDSVEPSGLVVEQGDLAEIPRDEGHLRGSSGSASSSAASLDEIVDVAPVEKGDTVLASPAVPVNDALPVQSGGSNNDSAAPYFDEGSVVVASEEAKELQHKTLVSDELAQLLSQLYGESVDEFAKDAKTFSHAIEIDCRSTDDDLDFKVNPVKTLCPFLREDGPCGVVRHPSYVLEEEERLCGEQCRPHINAIIESLSRRSQLTNPEDAAVFGSVVNALLLQYASGCRIGAFFIPN